MVSLIGLIYVFDALIGIWMTYRFLTFYKNSGNLFAKNFGMFALFLTTSFLFLGAPSFLTLNSRVLRVGYWIALMFLFIGITFLANIPSYFGRWKKSAPYFNWILRAGAIFFLSLSVIFPNKPYLTGEGILIWGIHPVPGALFAVFIFFFMLLISTVFFQTGHRARDKEIRIRPFLIGLSFVCASIGGALTHSFNNKDWVLAGHAILSFGFVLVALAMGFYP